MVHESLDPWVIVYNNNIACFGYKNYALRTSKGTTTQKEGNLYVKNDVLLSKNTEMYLYDEPAKPVD